jgi:hypothetical protein
MTHSPERRKEKAIDGIAVLSGKWDTGRDWRARLIFVQRLLVSGAI